MSAESYPLTRGNRTGLAISADNLALVTATGNWQQQLREAIRDPLELTALLDLPAESIAGQFDRSDPFPLLVPHAFARRMRKGDARDPLLLQVLPSAREAVAADGYSADPVAEQGLAQSGTIRKYPGRALLITTGACPVHCRYCFRREFPYSAQTASRDNWETAIEQIAGQDDIHELILSGGDPLSLSNPRLQRLFAAIEALPHVQTIRIHTRFPVVLPARVDNALIELLNGSRLNTVIVLHANHPAEIDGHVIEATKQLASASNYLLNQSVLLRDINDDAGTLVQLSERLLAAHIKPYYLHLLDRVTGTAHFEVSDSRATQIIATMRKQAPGYLVPTLVREIPGELSKTPVT